MPLYPPASSGSSGYNLIQDEGVALTARTTINFTGAGVTASDSGALTTVSIPGGAGAGWTLATVNIATPTKEYETTVVDASVGVGSKIVIVWADSAETGANYIGMGSVAVVAKPAAGSFTLEVYSMDASNLFGSFNFYYQVG